MIRALSLTAFCMLVLSSWAGAQDKHVHQGFWIGFGIGGGVNLSDALDNDQLVGGSGYLRLGGTPSQRVLLGGEAVGWAASQLNDVASRSNAMFIVMFFPSENGGFFIKGGVGAAAVARVTTATVQTETGLGLAGGLGYDVRLGSNLYLTPNLDLLFQYFDGENFAGLGLGKPNTNSILTFTLGLTWH
jgi:hypothetical protein